MGFFSDIGKLLGGAFSEVRREVAEEVDTSMFAYEYEKLTTMYSSLVPFAEKADDSYMALKFNRLNEVPAIELYDGNYMEKLDEINLKANELNSESPS